MTPHACVLPRAAPPLANGATGPAASPEHLVAHRRAVCRLPSSTPARGARQSQRFEIEGDQTELARESNARWPARKTAAPQRFSACTRRIEQWQTTRKKTRLSHRVAIS